MLNYRAFNALRVTEKNRKKTYWWAVYLKDAKGKKISRKGYNHFERISEKQYAEFLVTGRFRKNKYDPCEQDDSSLGKLPKNKERLFPRMPVHPRLRTPITYFGGKQTLLKYILPMIPGHRIYCEPFFGGGAVFFSKDKSETEVINDCNGEVINFYKILKTNFTALQKEVKGTLHSRQVYFQALHVYQNPKKFSEVKRAWAFWVLTNQGFAAMIGSWAFDNNNKKADALSRKREIFSSVYSERLDKVQVENKDALAVIDRCDTTDAFFYCDPPYMDCTQGHYEGYTKEDYEKLLKKLATVKGKFLLSSYPSAILTQYIKKYGWKSTSIRKSIAVTKLTDKKKTEMLVYNYTPSKSTMKTLSGLGFNKKYTSELVLFKSYLQLNNNVILRSELFELIRIIGMEIENGEIPVGSRFYPQVYQIYSNLISLSKKFKTSNSGLIKINPESLTEYKETIKKIEKARSLEGVNAKRKVKQNLIKDSFTDLGSIPDRMTAAQISKIRYNTLAFTGMWKEIFGELPEPFDMLIHSEPHAGKTKFLLKFAKYLAENFGKVMYATSEEYSTPGLKIKVNEILNPPPAHLEFTRNLDNFDFKDFKFVFIDSVNDMGLSFEGYKELQQKHPRVNFILVLQHTKAGEFRGSKEWEHKVSIGAKIFLPGIIRIYRNRLSGKYGDFDLIAEKPVLKEEAPEADAKLTV